jgi:hypothetical protein
LSLAEIVQYFAAIAIKRVRAVVVVVAAVEADVTSLFEPESSVIAGFGEERCSTKLKGHPEILLKRLCQLLAYFGSAKLAHFSVRVHAILPFLPAAGEVLTCRRYLYARVLFSTSIFCRPRH